MRIPRSKLLTALKKNIFYRIFYIVLTRICSLFLFFVFLWCLASADERGVLHFQLLFFFLKYNTALPHLEGWRQRVYQVGQKTSVFVYKGTWQKQWEAIVCFAGKQPFFFFKMRKVYHILGCTNELQPSFQNKMGGKGK